MWQTTDRQTTDHATEKWIAIREIACEVALQEAIPPDNKK